MKQITTSTLQEVYHLELQQFHKFTTVDVHSLGNFTFQNVPCSARSYFRMFLVLYVHISECSFKVHCVNSSETSWIWMHTFELQFKTLIVQNIWRCMLITTQNKYIVSKCWGQDCVDQKSVLIFW